MKGTVFRFWRPSENTKKSWPRRRIAQTMRDLAPGEHEAVNPWNVRETMLGVGHSAAARLEKSEAALSLNRENLESKQNRGAQPLKSQEPSSTITGNCLS